MLQEITYPTHNHNIKFTVLVLMYHVQLITQINLILLNVQLQLNVILSSNNMMATPKTQIHKAV